MRNKGTVTVEACLVVPVFLFFMMIVTRLSAMLLADAKIHQSLAEAAGYTAQYCYLEDRLKKNGTVSDIVNTGVLISQFRDYLGDSFYVDSCVAGGRNGIVITQKKDPDNPKVFYARADYCFQVEVPFLGKYQMRRRNEIRQKGFLGFDPSEEMGDTYVFITPNEAVYHMRRDCTHLELKVRKTTGTAGLSACRYCGKNSTGSYYIAQNGRVYHGSRRCSGLKRTVSRVKKSETGGLGPCQRCGR